MPWASAILPVFRDLVIAALGAFIAYLIWDWYNSAALAASEVTNWEVRYPDEGPAYITRLRIENIGNKAANGCRAHLWLRGRHSSTGDLYVSYLPLGWMNKRGELFANSARDSYKEVKIGRGDSMSVELFTHTFSDTFSLSDRENTGEMTMAKIHSDDFDSAELKRIGNDLLLNDERHVGRDGDLYEKSRNIELNEFHDIEWEDAEVQVLSNNAGQISAHLSISVLEGEIQTELVAEDGVSWLETLIR